MKLLHNLVIMTMVIAVGVVSIVFLDHIDKQHEELKSSRKAAFDSLLKIDSIHINCVKCGYPNGRSLFWIKDSAR